MLKAHTYFHICQSDSGPFCKRWITWGLSFLPIGRVGKNTCKTCKPDFTQTFDLLLQTSIFCYAARTFARLEVICISWIYE